MKQECKRIVMIGGGLLIALVVFTFLNETMRENYEVKRRP